VVRLEAGYGFIERDGLADWIFVHRRDTEEEAWRELAIGIRVSFSIAFSLRGPRAFAVRVGGHGPSQEKLF
jgi:cold shock CspA family protein